jgi:acetyltransferase-like isoleucine patch superfamily enzyme
MLKKLIVIIIALVPFNGLRIFLYRTLTGYGITYDSHVGWLNYIDVAECRITRGRIGHLNVIRARRLQMESGGYIKRFNHFKRVHNISLAAGSFIGTRNHFVGTDPGLTPFKEHENISIGEDSIITVDHMFDLSDTITLGRNVTFGGRGSEVWTHGFDLNHVKVQAPVEIGNDVYIGSRCIIIQGVQVTDSVSIGAGTIVSKSITEPGFYVSSHLTKKSEAVDYTANDQVVTFNKAKFLRK